MTPIEAVNVLRDALRHAADEPNIDKARAIADSAIEQTENLDQDEPIAWLVSVVDHDNQYFVEDPDDAIDDLTNHGAEITPLYAATQPASNGWISADRLPDDLNDYLVFMVKNCGTTYVTTSTITPSKDGFYVAFNEDGSEPVEEVTHWMPLPAAPSKDKT